MMLSKNFSLAEFTKSYTATRLRIKNTPTPVQVELLKALCENILEPVRAHFKRPVSVSSGFRSLALNRAIGSNDDSQHRKAEAVDFEIAGVPNSEVARFIRKNLDFDQLILEFAKKNDPNAGWVHVSFKATGQNRKQFLVIG